MAGLATLSNTKAWFDLADKAITNITKGNPAVVTCANHNFKTGRQVVISAVAGMTQVNNKTFTIAVVDGSSFSLGVDSNAYAAYSSGGVVGTDDELLLRLIDAISALIRKECGRDFISGDVTEYYNGTGSRRLMVRSTPITAIKSLHIDGLEIKAANPTPGGAGYLFDSDTIYLNGYIFNKSYQNVVVTYTVTPTSDELDLAEQICIRLVALEYKPRRERVGVSSTSLAGQNVSYSTEELPADVARMLNRLRRVAPV